MELALWGIIVTLVGMVFGIVKLERRVNKVYRKMRQVNARFEALEKAAGLEQTKTDIGEAL